MSQAGIATVSSSGMIPVTVPESFVTNSGTAIPSANTLNVLGTSGITTSGAGATVTISGVNATTSAVGVASFNPTNFTVNGSGQVSLISSVSATTLTGNTGGTIAPVANNINTLGTGSITIAGSGNTLTTELTGLTAHAVMVGAGTPTVTMVGPGAANTVLLGNGASSDPSFGTVPNAALTNSSITLSNGNNITITGSPVSLGGTATVNVSGTTQYSVQLGNASGSLTSLANGTTNQVLQANTGSNPSWSTATYPSTTTANQILYSSANNTVSGLTTANNGVLTTGTTGTPVITALSSNGQLIIGSGSGAPTAATLTAGTGVTITNAANSITISATNGLPVVQVNMDAGTSPITPNGSGVMIFTGGQVATGTVGTNVIRTNGIASNECSIQIQRTTTSATSNVTLNGVCHFSSSSFVVDGNGFVTFSGSLAQLPWTDESVSFNAVSNNGYFIAAGLTATLPASPNQGDIIRFVVDTSGTLTVQANTGQKIRVANAISASAGTAANTKQGDSLDLVYRSTSATWYTFSNPCGVWTIT